MRQQWIWVWLIVSAGTMVSVSSPSFSLAQEFEPAPTSSQVEFEQVMELDRDVHFLTPQGEDALISSGLYTVELVDGGLRLIRSDEKDPKPVIIQAESTNHDDSLRSSQLLSIPGEEDQHMVMLLLPDGTARQAIGTYSGMRTRGYKFNRGFLKGLKVPRIHGILTTPKFGLLQTNGTVIIKGENFGSFKEGNGAGKVLLHGRFKHNVPSTVLKIEEWSTTKVKARVLSDSLETQVVDQTVKLQIKTAKSLSSTHIKMPFRAARNTRWLSFKDQVVKVKHCSKRADINLCNGHMPNTNGGICGLIGTAPVWKNREAAIWGRHKNCDLVVDWDAGTDHYNISLKNGWIFKKFWRKAEKNPALKNGSTCRVIRHSMNQSWEHRPGTPPLNGKSVRVTRSGIPIGFKLKDHEVFPISRAPRQAGFDKIS